MQLQFTVLHGGVNWTCDVKGGCTTNCSNGNRSTSGCQVLSLHSLPTARAPSPPSTPHLDHAARIVLLISTSHDHIQWPTQWFTVTLACPSYRALPPPHRTFTIPPASSTSIASSLTTLSCSNVYGCSGSVMSRMCCSRKEGGAVAEWVWWQRQRQAAGGGGRRAALLRRIIRHQACEPRRPPEHRWAPAPLRGPTDGALAAVWPCARAQPALGLSAPYFVNG